MNEQEFFVVFKRASFVLSKQQVYFTHHRYRHQASFAINYQGYKWHLIYRYVWQKVWHLARNDKNVMSTIAQHSQSNEQVFMYFHIGMVRFLPSGAYMAEAY